MSEFIFPFSPDKHFGPGQLLSQHDGMRIFDLHHPTEFAAIKSGGSAAGSRAASSHTGALASSDVAVEALFRKAGIVRCNGRDELATVAAIFNYPELRGKNMAIVTHAGGPAVMLTDALSDGGMEIPHLELSLIHISEPTRRS